MIVDNAILFPNPGQKVFNYFCFVRKFIFFYQCSHGEEKSKQSLVNNII
jgi:hypothetical protein